MKLVKTDLYLLLIDEKAEIMYNDLCYDIYGSPGYNNIKYVVRCLRSANDTYWNKHTSKIIAYRKLNSEAKELDLPLLPPFEVTKSIEHLAEEKADVECQIDSSLDYAGFYKGFISGYKEAQSKGKYSLEDIKKAINEGFQMARNSSYGDIPNDEYVKEFIQSLSTQQLPSEFIPEYEDIGYSCSYPPKEMHRVDENSFYVPIQIKVITNSKGKEELVGTYKY